VKRVALVVMMVTPLLLGWVVPALAGEYDVVVQLARLHQLGETSLSDADLAAVSGRGTQRATGQAEADRVIIWDEGPANAITSHHSLTGHGGTQNSTVTINGR
jgi:hypothetical protein